MNYNEFCDAVLTKVKESAAEYGSVRLTTVLKNNGVELVGLSFMPQKGHIGPTIYLEDYYEKHNDGIELDSIVGDIMAQYRRHAKVDMELPKDFFRSFECVKDKLFYKVINYDRNRELLKNVPHRRIMDLAMVFLYMVKSDENCNSTITIRNSNIKSWGIDEEELYQVAMANTPRMFEASLKNMGEILGCVELIEGKPELVVLSNSCGVFGAGVMFYPDIFQLIGTELEEDLLILPSSIHEVIIIRKSEFENIERLRTMVKEVNNTELIKEDVLSESVYMYSYTERRLMIA